MFNFISEFYPAFPFGCNNCFFIFLLREVYKFLPAGVLFLASFLHFERKIVSFSSHQGGYLNFCLNILFGIVLVKVAFRIIKN